MIRVGKNIGAPERSYLNANLEEVVSSIFRTLDLVSMLEGCCVEVVLLLAPMGARSKAVRR